jgi:hypothetical protein
MTWEAPVLEDLGTIAENTYQTPGDGHKGFEDPTNTDGMFEISHPVVGS